MVAFLPANPRKSFADQLNAGLDQAIPMWQNTMRQNQQKEDMLSENATLQKLTGKSFAGIKNPEMRKALMAEMLKGQSEVDKFKRESEHESTLQDRKYGYEQIIERLKGEGKLSEANTKATGKQNEANAKAAQELQEKVVPLQNALKTVADMRNLRKTGKLGIGSTMWPTGEVRKMAGEYAQLGKSLISMASNIPIRNKAEFETLAEGLYDPNITDATAEGTLNAMEKILSRALEEYQGQGGGSSSQGKPSLDYGPGTGIGKTSNNKERPPLSSFQR